MRIILSSFLIIILLTSSILGPSSVHSYFQPGFAQISNDVDDLGNYVVFGLEKVEIAKNVKINSGDVGVNNAQAEIGLDKDVIFIDSNSVLVGDSVKIEKDSIIQNIFFNELENKGNILGTQNTPLNLPIVERFPNIPDLLPGSMSIDVDKNETLILTSGQYDKIFVDENGTLIFEGGLYSVTSIEIKKDAKIFFDDVSEIVVQDEIKLDKETTLGPSQTSGINASDIVIFVGNNLNPNASTNVDFDKDSVISANIFAPNGEIKMDKGVTATGSFVANEIKIEKDSTLTLDSQFGILVLTEEFEEILKEIDALFLLIEQDSDAAIFETVNMKIERLQLIVTELENSGISVEIEVVESSPLQLNIKFIKSGIIQKILIVAKTVCGITAVTGLSEYYTDVLTIPDLTNNHEKNALAIIIGEVCVKAPQEAFISNPESTPQVQRFLETIGLYLIGQGSAFDVSNVLNQPFIRFQMLDVVNNILNIYSLLLDQVALVQSVITNISAMIMGIVFDDDNGNQVQDGTEGTLSDWQITLTDLETELILDTTQTDFNGQYVFSDAVTAFTKVEAEIKLGTEQTLPDPTGPTEGTYHVNIMSKSFLGETTVLDFGNRLIPVLSSGLDIVVGSSNRNSSPALVLLTGDDSGGFIPTSISSPAVYDIAVADFNGDGLDDIVTTSRNPFVGIHLGQSEGGFGSRLVYSMFTPSGPQTFAVVAADLNQDGKPDIATANRASNDITVIFNTTPTGETTPTFTIAQRVIVSPFFASSPEDIDAADVNNNGKLDLIVSGKNSKTVFVLLEGGGIGTDNTFASFPSADRPVPYEIALVDFDGDGDQDILQIGDSILGDFLTVLENFGLKDPEDPTRMNFTATQNVVFGSSLSPRSFDFTNNGQTVISANLFGDSLTVFRNQGTYTPVLTIPLDSGSQPIQLLLSDVLGNPSEDAIIANLVTNNVVILEGPILPSSTSTSIDLLGMIQPNSLAVGNFG